MQFFVDLYLKGFYFFTQLCHDTWFLQFLCFLYGTHGPMDVKTPNPICRLFFLIDLLTDFAALCLTDFIDWRYNHSVVCIFEPACELLPPWTKELYLCTGTVAPLPSLWPSPPPPNYMYSIYRQCVWLWGEGDVELCCRPYSAGVVHSVSDQIQNLPRYKIATPPQTKMTSKDDIKGFVSLKFLPLWRYRTRYLTLYIIKCSL